jgi:hypothetical protein
MITASLVLYKSDLNEVSRILTCVRDSVIERIYVVDNSPTDLLRETITHFKEKVEYIYGQGNVGFGEGNNIAIKKAINNGSRYHIVLNPDIVFESESINQLLCFMDNHPEVGCVKPALTHIDGSFNASALELPSPFVTFGRRLLPKSITKSLNARFELRDCDLNVVREVPNMSGSFLFIRTKVLELVGLFDNRYFMYFEDFDLVRRLHCKSKIVYYPKVSVIHAHRAEHKFNKKLLMISIKSAIKYFNKWGWLYDTERRKWNKATRQASAIIEEK